MYNMSSFFRPKAILITAWAIVSLKFFSDCLSEPSRLNQLAKEVHDAKCCYGSYCEGTFKSGESCDDAPYSIRCSRYISATELSWFCHEATQNAPNYWPFIFLSMLMLSVYLKQLRCYFEEEPELLDCNDNTLSEVKMYS